MITHSPTSAMTPWLDCKWPSAARQDKATLFCQDMHNVWNALKQNAVQKEIIHLPNQNFTQLLESIGGNSPYLSELCLKNPVFFANLLTHGPDHMVTHCFTQLQNASPSLGRDEIAKTLRIAKQHVALTCAFADIGNIWPLARITSTLSLLAEYSLTLAINHLLLNAHKNGALTLTNVADPSFKSGFIILAMGKLGAKELNYSSDIDLILLYDPACHAENDRLSTLFVRMGQDLVTLMARPDENGYVFRTDLRLRPEPSATPAVISLPAALSYYESYGQTWERAAFIKATPIAGDKIAGEQFLRAISPFIWRRHLDFGLIDDIHTMKQRIDHHHSRTRDTLPDPKYLNNLSTAEQIKALLSHNVKLGQGGIREIEFMAQAMQLVWGGRYSDLQRPQTVTTLTLLADKQLIDHKLAQTLIRAYQLLRQIEHRLQMVNDRQTHSLPSTEEELKALALFCGYEDESMFAHILLQTLCNVHSAFQNQFVVSSSPEQETLNPLAPDLDKKLADMGFESPHEAAEIVHGWGTNGLRALKSSQARSLLITLLPSLLEAICLQAEPLTVLKRFDGLLAQHRAGLQFLSLLEHNPALIQRIMAILGSSSFLSEYLAEAPSALDILLSTEDIGQVFHSLTAYVGHYAKQHPSTEELIPFLRSLIRGEQFRLAIAQIEGRLGVDRAGLLRSQLADLCIRTLYQSVSREHRSRYGTVAEGGMVVVALGKAGSQQMMAGSDLDLMMIYHHSPLTTESKPVPRKKKSKLYGRSLPVDQYYLRLSHALIAALTAPGAEGPLFDIDMRLRPSGKKGPVAVSLASFNNYHASQAWTWERMALTRARVVSGAPQHKKAVLTAITRALQQQHTVPRVQSFADVRAMRARLSHDHAASSLWDIKFRPGGLMDVEFLAQILQLTSSTEDIYHIRASQIFKKLASTGELSAHDAKTLIQADHLWRALQSMLRLLIGTRIPSDDTAPLALFNSQLLLRELPPSLYPNLSVKNLPTIMDHVSGEVRAIFERILKTPSSDSAS